MDQPFINTKASERHWMAAQLRSAWAMGPGQCEWG